MAAKFYSIELSSGPTTALSSRQCKSMATLINPLTTGGDYDDTDLDRHRRVPEYEMHVR